ncbi:MAG: conjugal transfer protein TraN [Thermodesulfobacterium sp.]|nr:conjugal transfer protein TraN [Thermodesulfobacterium sp.]
MCSPNKCFTTTDIQDDEPDVIPSGYQDDGEITEDGVCLGSIFIFNGYEMRCRPAGLQTGFQNCCDEAQGKIYDSTGSLSGTFTTVKNVIAAISASKQVAQIGYYATKIASGEYALQATGTGVAELVNTATGEVVTTYATDSAEAIALAQVDTGMSADVAVQTAGTTYISQLKADIALAIVNLAVSQVIDDPLVAATVNFAATLAVPYLFPGATISPVGLAFAAINIALAFFGGGCDKQDILTSTYKESGYCHYVGSKCIKKLPLVGCVQKAKVYCCFNSKLARIIHEQGRPQLANFQGNLWGSAKHPICRGFTPEEFQALDFSKMDLSEYYADIERNMTENLQQKITTQINETYEGLR